MGDFNARKGNLLDLSVDSDNDFHPTGIGEISDINVGVQAFVNKNAFVGPNSQQIRKMLS